MRPLRQSCTLLATLERTRIAGDTVVHFDIAHQDRGEIDLPTFDRSIVAHVVQHEMIASILGKNVTPSEFPAHPPSPDGGTAVHACRAHCTGGDTRGNSSEGVDVWGTGHGRRQRAAARQDADPAGVPRPVDRVTPRRPG